MSTSHLSEQEQLRLEKLAELIMMGIEPYPAPLYPVNSNSIAIKTNYAAETKEQFAEVCLAGRIMSVRDREDQLCSITGFAWPYTTLCKADDICPVR